MHARSLSLTALTLAGGLLFGAAPEARGQRLDELVLAVVHEDKITRRQLVERLLEYQGEATLDRAITRALVQQAARQAKVSVPDEEVLARYRQVRGRFKNDEAYQNFLRSVRLREDQHRDELRASLLIERLALKDVLISNEDMQQYEIRMLVAPDRAAADKWAMELTPATFNQAALERNAEPALKQAGGRMRPFLFVEMLDVSQAIRDQKLKPGEFTRKPVALAGGKWVLIKLDRILPVTAVGASERERLETLLNRYHMDQWLSKIRTAARIERRGPKDANPATVNGEAITQPQLVARLLEFSGEEELDRMINRALLVHAAGQQKVTLTDAEAEKQYQEVRKRFPTAEAFEEFLGRSNLTEKQFRDEVRYNTLLERVVLRESPIKDEDLTRYAVRMLIAPDRKTAEDWVKDLNNGADFARMAAERSADPEGRMGAGLVKPFVRVELLEIWRILQDQGLKPGGYTRRPVLLTDNTWGVIKLEGILPVQAATSQEREQLTAVVRNFRVNQWLEQTLRTARDGGKVSKPTAIGPAVIQGG